MNLIKSLFVTFLAMMVSCSIISAKKSTDLKPHLVVMTDIGDCNVEPDDMESAIHIICEVKDNGPFHLVSYARIVCEVKN